MDKSFYKTKEYKKKQSNITKRNWKKGIFDFVYQRERRKCARKGCNNFFEVIPSDQKIYCCMSCSGLVNNAGRGPLKKETKRKIAKALTGRKNTHFAIKISRVKVICANPRCKKIFLKERWMNKRFCNVNCAMAVIGGKPTSPRASRGKAGIRKDISKKIYFYSRWEANFARLLNYLKIKWQYQPKTFDLKTQNYTPDFYLPGIDSYIEIKNFLWKYSKIRDDKFRKIYPDIKLQLVLKDDYLKLEKTYSPLIKKWEYKNSRFIVN